jgi:sarcosine oxidase subunit gamma
MSDAARRESRLAVDGLFVQERAFLGHVNLRCDPRDGALASALEQVLGCGLPRTPNTFHAADTAAGGNRCLWLGPDEWLVIMPEGREADMARALRQAAGDGFAAVNELGSGQTVIELTGPRAREIIAKGCPLDLHPRVFGPGRCAQSRLARTLVTIAQIDATPRFELIVRRSYADYLWQWLADASAFGITPKYV